MAALDKIVPAKFQPLWMHPAGKIPLNNNNYAIKHNFQDRKLFFSGHQLLNGYVQITLFMLFTLVHSMQNVIYNL